MITIKMALTEDYLKYSSSVPGGFEKYYAMPRVYVMHALQDETVLLGVIAARCDNEQTAEILDIYFPEYEWGITDGTIRAMLNFLNVCKIKMVFYNKQDYIEEFEKIGFEESNKGFSLELYGFFNKVCGNGGHE